MARYFRTHCWRCAQGTQFLSASGAQFVQETPEVSTEGCHLKKSQRVSVHFVLFEEAKCKSVRKASRTVICILGDKIPG